MAAPAGYVYGTRGGRLSGFKLVGIVGGGLVETLLHGGAPSPMGPRGTPPRDCGTRASGRGCAR